MELSCPSGNCNTGHGESSDSESGYGGGGGGDDDWNTDFQNPDGSFREAETIGELIAFLISCETIGDVIGVIFANLYLIFSALL